MFPFNTEDNLPPYLSMVGTGEYGRAFEVCTIPDSAIEAVAAGELSMSQGSPSELQMD
ncbi:MAG: hypothetical protein F6K31_03245 [Symploca sp. SIO2G7]|nr:hypothetical protein [Symploca sp. SIO2G7]